MTFEKIKRYQIEVEMGRDDWYGMTNFDTIDEAVNWIYVYDPEGTVRMKVVDTFRHREVDLVEWDKRNRKKIVRGDWKEEGF